MRRATIPAGLGWEPITTAQALAAGVSHSKLRNPVWRQMLRGVWVRAEVEDTRELRLAAVKLILTNHAFVCGESASWIHGVDVDRMDSLRLNVGCKAGRRLRKRRDLRIRELVIDINDLQRIRGVCLTTPVRTAFDCARWLDLVRAVIVVDSLANRGLMTIEELSAYLDSKRKLPGIRKVPAVIALADARAESPMETRVRLVLNFAGLWPEPQFKVSAAGCSYRLDLAFPQVKVAVEYDGAWHFEQRQQDELRREALRREGWVIIVVTKHQLFAADGAASVVARVRSELAMRGQASSRL